MDLRSLAPILGIALLAVLVVFVLLRLLRKRARPVLPDDDTLTPDEENYLDSSHIISRPAPKTPAAPRPGGRK